jgi:hypothetical protein
MLDTLPTSREFAMSEGTARQIQQRHSTNDAETVEQYKSQFHCRFNPKLVTLAEIFFAWLSPKQWGIQLITHLLQHLKVNYLRCVFNDKMLKK